MEDRERCLVTEWCSGGDLGSVLDRYSGLSQALEPELVERWAIEVRAWVAAGGPLKSCRQYVVNAPL